MQLSLQTDYALRMLMALSVSGKRLRVDDIAQQYDISRNHLAKVAQQLSSSGYVQTVRGRNGGLVLAIPATDINVGAVVREFENLGSFVACMPDGKGCAVTGLCSLKPALAGALEAFLAHLDQFQLSEMIPDEDAFLKRLMS